MSTPDRPDAGAAAELQQLAIRSALVLFAVGALACVITGLAAHVSTDDRWLSISVGGAALGIAVGGRRVPWQRWGRGAQLWLLPPALVLVGVANYANPEPYSSSVVVLVIGIWLGFSQRRGVPLALSPLLALDFWLPIRLAHHGPTLDQSVPYILVAAAAGGEWVAWLLTRLARADARVRALLESRLDGMSRASHDVTMWVDPDGTIRHLSASAAHIFGIDPTAYVGGPAVRLGDRIAHPEDRERGQDLVMTPTPVGTFRSVEQRLLHADGRWHWTEIVSHGLADGSGLEGHLISMHDIGERKEAEERVRSSERNFRVMFERSPLPMWVHDPDSLAILWVNAAACELFGYPKEHLLTLHALDVVDPVDHSAVRDAFASTTLDRQGRGLARHVTSDQRTLDIDVTAQLVELEGRLRVLVLLQDVTNQREQESRLRHAALHDPLTGLANRALLEDRMQHALAANARNGRHVALVVCDLDGFKGVNDTLGHQAGDELLTLASHRLTGLVRPGDTVARFGGDEFAILLPDLEDPGSARVVADRIIEALGRPFPLEFQTVAVGVSVGLTVGRLGSTAHSLLREADTAMYEAKAAGKGRVRAFEAGMQARVSDRLDLANRLPGALERGEFFLEYQPGVRLSDGVIQGFEALARWRHPVRGVLAPGTFLPLAEETGFILSLGRWVLHRACADAATWTALRGEGARVTVNVSAHQVRARCLVDDVRSALAASHLPPPYLALEFTEGLLIQDPERAMEVLTTLREMGVKVAFDNFGAGYASLPYVARFPFDLVKVDKSVVQSVFDGGASVVRGVAELCHALGMQAVAQGVETGEQRRALEEMGYDSAQGYLFYRPVSPDAATALVGLGGIAAVGPTAVGPAAVGPAPAPAVAGAPGGPAQA